MTNEKNNFYEAEISRNLNSKKPVENYRFSVENYGEKLGKSDRFHGEKPSVHLICGEIGKLFHTFSTGSRSMKINRSETFVCFSTVSTAPTTTI